VRLISLRDFFPPEMAFRKSWCRLCEECGFKWIILDEIALNGQTGSVDYTKLYKIKGSSLQVYFPRAPDEQSDNERRGSLPETLKEAMAWT